jgi:hypothetical protein
MWSHPSLECPVSFDGQQRRCIWPGRLNLALEEQGGEFHQEVRVYREADIVLPGSLDHWPQEITVEGEPAVILNRKGVPSVHLDTGQYRINGRFIWDRLPESLRVPKGTGIVELTVNGKQQLHPAFKQGSLWLRAKTPTASEQPQDTLSLTLFRKLDDRHPFQMTTRLELQVSGKRREAMLGTPLPEGFSPLAIRSLLPARLEADGRLRVQLRPGRWELEVDSVHPAYLKQLTLRKQPSPWPAEEIFVFQSQPDIRLVEVESGVQVDPRQTRLPEAWRNLPAYRVKAGQTFRLKVIRRGNPEPAPDNLSLRRTLWLDFSGKGLTVQDRIQGTISSGWRLSVAPAIALGRVSLNGQPQFITRMGDRNGVEVRQGTVNLVAESRLEKNLPTLPVTGWGQDMQKVSATLKLPPGWRLIATSGVDVENRSWLRQWTLYDFFIVFVLATGAGKLWGWRWALPVLLVLGMTWHEPGAPQGIWLYLMLVTALRRVLAEGKVARAMRGAWLGGLITLALIAVPFAVEQARTGLYPQLAPHNAAFVATDAVTLNEQQDKPVEAEESAYERKKERLKSLGQSRSGSYSYLSAPPSRKQWSVDPGARIQTGPGLPDWEWNAVPLGWNGPVDRGQTMHLFLLSPKWNLPLNFLRILLVGLLVWRFFDWKIPRRLTRTATPAVLLMGLLLTGLTGGMPGPATASDYPPMELLKELERRLTLPPDCLPQCADVERMQIDLKGDGYQVLMQISASEDVAVPLLGDIRQITPLQVSVDGESASLARDDAGRLWAGIPKGRHSVTVSGRLPKQREIALVLPLTPHRFKVVGEDWRVEGVRENGVPGNQLLLIRKQTAGPSEQKAAAELQPGVLPPFLSVERTLHLGLDWTVETRVTRLSSEESPVTLQVPLLASESVVTDGVSVAEGKVLVNLVPGAREFGWSSRLEPAELIRLEAPETEHWLETWRVDASPVWHLQLSGLAPVHNSSQGSWMPEWMPWAGEQVAIQVSRPEGVAGPVLTITGSKLEISPGTRATDGKLEIQLRASQGGRYPVRIPQGAKLQQVQVDGKRLPVRPEGAVVSLPVHPGKQRYTLSWREGQGVTARWETPEVNLGMTSVNADTRVNMGQDRWILFASGPRLGPAVLFWGDLLIVLGLAVVLGRLKEWTPLGVGSWFLLGIGLTQVDLVSTLVVVVTLLALGYRRRQYPDAIRGFNWVQVGLVLLVLSSGSVLLWSIQQGLLGEPRMQVMGNGSWAYQLNWYQDRSGEVLTQSRVYSLPITVYRWLMLAWALWLAFSVLKWSKWSWDSFSHGGRWKKIDFQLPRRGMSSRKKVESKSEGNNNQAPK